MLSVTMKYCLDAASYFKVVDKNNKNKVANLKKSLSLTGNIFLALLVNKKYYQRKKVRTNS